MADEIQPDRLIARIIPGRIRTRRASEAFVMLKAVPISCSGTRQSSGPKSGDFGYTEPLHR